jgi:hypothetical protein
MCVDDILKELCSLIDSLENKEMLATQEEWIKRHKEVTSNIGKLSKDDYDELDNKYREWWEKR